MCVCKCFKKKEEGAETGHMCVHAEKYVCVQERKKEGDIRMSAAVGDFFFLFFCYCCKGFSPDGVSSYLIDAQRLSVRYHKPGELPAAARRRQRVLRAQRCR